MISSEYNIWFNLIIPFASTLFLIYLMPYFTNELYRQSLKHQSKKEQIKYEKDGKRRLTEEESREIIEKQILMQNKFDDINDRNNKRIEDLEKIIIERDKEIRKLNEKPDSSKIKTSLDIDFEKFEDQLNTEQNKEFSTIKYNLNKIQIDKDKYDNFINRVINGWRVNDELHRDLVVLFAKYELIEKNNNNYFTLNQKGKEFLRFLDETEIKLDESPF